MTMFEKFHRYNFQLVLGALLLAGSLSSCTKYVDAGAPTNQLTVDKVFADSATALGSVLTIYTYYTKSSDSYLLNLNQYGAMSADEGYYFQNSNYTEYTTNTMTSGDNLSNTLWYAPYEMINLANYNLQGLTNDSALSANFRNQLIGECEFWRAWCYFHLINYFGAVPLVTTYDALNNTHLPRTDTNGIYNQIVADLLDAKTKLTATYSTYTIAERARVNKYAVSALLARVYLYRKSWSAAETEATNVIGSGIYSLGTNLDSVFVKTSNEVIFQDAALYTTGISGITKMGVNWIPSSTTPLFVLYDTLANTFETGDLRKNSWTKPITYSGKTYYYPYKDKIRTTAVSGNEYYVMFRLAEQYLIRSEARAQQANISGAQDDLNAIRNRAGLGNTSATDLPGIMTALEHERWVELFTEYSDRWYNLRRTGRSDAVFSSETEKKATWQSYQALWPVPLSQYQANPSLLPNNPGYN